MAKRFLCFFVLVAFCLIGSTDVMAQTSSSGQLSGTVSDQTGAVIAGATVKIKDDATGSVFETKSSADGHFSAGSLRPGTYTVTVSLQGFKSAEYRAVKITIGQVYDLSAKLEVGALESTVVVEAGAEVLETVSTTIGTSITGKNITQLPLSSRDALDLAILMPGAATTGRARQTSFMGLPKGAINITMDGINAQDNLLKSNDGFFTLIRPRIDAIEEFSISTAGQGSEQSGEGAVQIRFETKRGGNVYHGGGWWYHRNDFFNSNYYFSNQTKTPRQRQRLNQYGGNIGGPVWKDKMFFFVSMDIYRNPSSQVRTRTILSPQGLSGRFTYAVSAIPATAASLPWMSCSSTHPRMTPTSFAICEVNLFTLAAQNYSALPGGAAFAGGFSTTLDPLVATALNAVNGARTTAGVATASISNPWLDFVTFNNPGDATRRFPDLRLDYNITKNIQWTGIYHYNYFTSTPDFLNSLDRTFPVTPYSGVFGSQISNRNEWVTALRWNIAANKSNEVRAGLVTAPVSFFPDQSLSFYPPATHNAGTVNIRETYPSITTPLPAFNAQGRNGGLFQLIDTFSWSKGKHNIMFGGNWTRVRLVGFFSSRAVNTASLGLAAGDPSSTLMFTTQTGTTPVPTAGGFAATGGNLPGASTADLGNARGLYGALLGTLTAYSGTISVDEPTRKFIAGAPLLQRTNQHEFGIYANDSWRIHPQITLNFGLRWELQRAGVDPKNIAYHPQGGVAGTFGPSGLNNIFKPGTLTGAATVFELNGKRQWYNDDMNNFAPNIGVAWTPNFTNTLLKTIFGDSGKSVFRVTYSTVYTREGVQNWQSTAFTNPGLNGSIFSNPAARSTACPAPPYTTTTFAVGTYPAGCLTLSGLFNGDLQTVNINPAAFPDTTPFQILAFAGQQVADFDPNLRVPLVHNWSIGIQREITPGMVIEARYVGNHSVGLWRLDNVNEINIFENGFLSEFAAAKSNLAINGGSSFANNNPLLGTVPLPIMTQMFSGLAASLGFSNSTFIQNLNNNAVGSFAAGVANSATYLCRLVGFAPLAGAGPNPCPTGTAGVGIVAGPTAFPVNFWVANPQATSGSFRMRNGGQSTYNGFTLEVRKRYSKGLQFSGNYTFAKALTNYFADASNSNSNLTTLRDPGNDKGPSPWDLRHSFKINGIYSLPFGPGRKWNSSHGWVNRIVEGWEISGINRWQSGRVFQLTGGNNNRTFNASDSGVILAGITPKQIQDSLNIRKLPTGQVFYFPASLISSTGTANNTFIRPCDTAGKLCSRISLYGPSFFRMDLNVVKKIRITERVEMEYRAEFLNAFNNINFFFPLCESTSVATVNIISGSAASPCSAAAPFGQVNSAFRDVSTTDDNGGRIIQMVLRVRF